MKQSLQEATFGGGCFWCTEAVFKRLKGVENVLPGYAGGDIERTSYEEVSSGTTGHAEAIQIEFDANVIPYERLLDVFFGTHDPTTMNQQGPDVGEQYRSVIFTHSDEQRRAAEEVKAKLEHDRVFDRPLVTQIVPFTNFFPAEDYHRDYYAKNPDQSYCQAVISPKVAKLREGFREYLKESGVQP